MFAVKFAAQQWLYDANQTAWLAVARIVGYALTGWRWSATFWAVAGLGSASAAPNPPDRTD